MREASREELLETIEKLEAETYKLSLELSQIKKEMGLSTRSHVQDIRKIYELQDEVERLKSFILRADEIMTRNSMFPMDIAEWRSIVRSANSSEGVDDATLL